jgi:hypothetical protein
VYNCQFNFHTIHSYQYIPLECQIQEHEEDTEAVSNPILGAGILSSHGSKARSSDDHSDEASNIHLAAGVDFVMEPGTKRVIYATYCGQLAWATT